MLLRHISRKVGNNESQWVGRNKNPKKTGRMIWILGDNGGRIMDAQYIGAATNARGQDRGVSGNRTWIRSLVYISAFSQGSDEFAYAKNIADTKGTREIPPVGSNFYSFKADRKVRYCAEARR